MAEKTSKKTVAITILRERPALPKIVVTTGFKLRYEKTTGLVDIYLQGYAPKGERVCLDAALLQTNMEQLKRYAAGLGGDQDDAAQKEDVAVSDAIHFANIAYFSHMGPRAETVFGVFSLSDWVDATRDASPGKTPEIKSVDSVVAISTLPVQKKLLLELLLLLSSDAKQ